MLGAFCRNAFPLIEPEPGEECPVYDITHEKVRQAIRGNALLNSLGALREMLDDNESLY